MRIPSCMSSQARCCAEEASAASGQEVAAELASVEKKALCARITAVDQTAFREGLSRGLVSLMLSSAAARL